MKKEEFNISLVRVHPYKGINYFDDGIPVVPLLNCLLIETISVVGKSITYWLISSGGMPVTVKGSRLHIIQAPRIIVRSSKGHSFFEVGYYYLLLINDDTGCGFIIIFIKI